MHADDVINAYMLEVKSLEEHADRTAKKLGITIGGPNSALSNLWEGARSRAPLTPASRLGLSVVLLICAKTRGPRFLSEGRLDLFFGVLSCAAEQIGYVKAGNDNSEQASLPPKILALIKTQWGKDAANKKLLIDPKQSEKKFVHSCWEQWKEEPNSYASKAAFARDMLNKCEHLTSQKKIEDWCREWEKTGTQPAQ